MGPHPPTKPDPEPLPNPDPRCPKCGFTMCELFQYTQVSSNGWRAIPNGDYRCFGCSGVK